MTGRSSTELLAAPATEIAGAIRQRVVSTTEVLELHLQHIADVSPRLNAIVTLVEERARAAAARADRELASGREVSPLHGVPFTVKDIIATEGIRTTGGSLVLRDFVPLRSAPAVERLERAGAILLGKTNCPEFALDLHTWNRVFGGTRNPWNEEFTSGGSSGGDSAAVASGCSAFGIGTDYGGSIRWPAHCTGIASLRPTVGIVPATGQLPYSSPGPLPPPNSMSIQSRLQMIAPIARTVGDLWEILSIMAGPDGRDEHTVPVSLGDPGGVRVEDLTCAWFEGDGSYPVRADLVEVVERAAECLADAGLKVLYGRPPGLERAESVFAPLRAADGLPDHVALATGREEQLTDNIRWWFAGTKPVTVAEYRRLEAERDALRATVLRFAERCPIFLLPVASVPAFRPDPESFAIDPELIFTVEGVAVPRFGILTCTRAISVLGFPAAVVACGTSREGMPVGVQVVGRPFADHEVVAVASVLEQAFGRWRPSAKSVQLRKEETC